MLHLTRWRIVTATATTAVVAAGAFGLGTSLTANVPDPAPIELRSIGDVPVTPTDDGPVELTTATPDTPPSVQTVDSIVSPDGPVVQREAPPPPPPPDSPPDPSSLSSPSSPSSVSSPSSLDS